MVTNPSRAVARLAILTSAVFWITESMKDQCVGWLSADWTAG